MEIFKGSKDEMIQEGFKHKLIIKKITPKDGARYTLECDGVSTSAYLTVKGRCRLLPMTLSMPVPAWNLVWFTKPSCLKCFLFPRKEERIQV